MLSDVLQLLDQLFVQLSLQVDVPFTGSLQMVDGVHHQLETVHVDVRSDPPSHLACWSNIESTMWMNASQECSG